MWLLQYSCYIKNLEADYKELWNLLCSEGEFGCAVLTAFLKRWCGGKKSRLVILQWYQTLWFAMFVFFMLYCRGVVFAVFRTCVAYTTQVNSTFHMRWLASSEVISQVYTCQLFLKYRPDIFILGVLGFLKTTQSFPNIPKEVRSLPKTSLCDVNGNSPCISQSQS